MARLVYRSGSKRDDNLTPRPGKDTDPKPGVLPGLSVFLSLELAVPVGAKAQVFDLDLLAEPLQALADDPKMGDGQEGHVSIAPATPEGIVDQALLDEWSATRGTGQVHWLTELLKNAQVEADVRRNQ